MFLESKHWKRSVVKFVNRHTISVLRSKSQILQSPGWLTLKQRPTLLRNELFAFCKANICEVGIDVSGRAECCRWVKIMSTNLTIRWLDEPSLDTLFQCPWVDETALMLNSALNTTFTGRYGFLSCWFCNTTTVRLYVIKINIGNEWDNLQSHKWLYICLRWRTWGWQKKQATDPSNLM